MELTQLRHFAAAAEHQNLSKAARALGQSTSALSRSLKRLELSVNGSLFERTGHGLKLSDLGTTLLEYAHTILNEHDRAMVAISATGKQKSGVLRIGVVRYLADFGLAAPIAKLLRRFPKAGIEVLDSSFEDLLHRLSNAELDVVIATMTSALIHDELLFEPVVKSDLIYVAAASHPLAKKRVVTAEDMMHERIIMSNRPAMIRSHYRRFSAAGEPVDFHPLITSSPGLTRQLLLTGDFIAISSRHAVAADIQAGRLAELRRKFRPDSLPIGMLVRKRGVKSALLTAFMGEARTALRAARK